MPDINLGLIGMGQMGKTHFRNCFGLRHAKLIAVSDISEKSLHEARRANLEYTYKDYNKLIGNSKIDAIIISLPTFLHEECILKAAEASKDIFVEKPLARNVDEGENILSKVRKTGVKVMVGYPLRFSARFTRLKDRIKQGVFGDIQIATAANIGPGPFSGRIEESRPMPVPSWWFEKNLTGGGALLDLGSHIINLFKWYFGKTTHIKSYLGHRFNMDLEDHAICLLRFGDCPVAIINVGWFSRDFRIDADLYGTSKHVSVSHKASGLLSLARRVEKSPFYKELQYFVDCIKTDMSPSPSAEEAVEDLKVIATAYSHSLKLEPESEENK